MNSFPNPKEGLGTASQRGPRLRAGLSSWVGRSLLGQKKVCQWSVTHPEIPSVSLWPMCDVLVADLPPQVYVKMHTDKEVFALGLCPQHCISHLHGHHLAPSPQKSELVAGPYS